MSFHDFAKGAGSIRRRTFLLAGGAAMLVPMTGKSLLAQEAPRTGGQINFASWPTPTHLISGITTSGPDTFLGMKFLDGLLEYDFGMQPKPGLAESWEVAEDGLRITFKLRQGVKWHDGEPLTSKDVAFTVMQITKVHHGRGRSTFANVTAVETPDEHTAIFVLSDPAPAVMKSLDSREVPILPAHLYEGTDIMSNPHNTKPVGTGAWKLVEYKVGESLVLERNPDYWREGKPNIDVMTIQYVGDPATRTALLESGTVDVVTDSRIPLSDLERLRETGNFEITDSGYESYALMQVMDFRLDHEILGKKEVRQALAHAIDLEWISQNVWYGYSPAATGPIHQDHSEYYTTDGVTSYPFDLAKAEEMLDAAGYPRGADGTRFELTMVASPYGDEPLRTSEYMREQFRQIGINLVIVSSDTGAYVKRVYTDRDYDLNMYVAASGADPVVGIHRFYKSSAIKPGVAYTNISGFQNEEVDALLDAAEIELDAAKRREQYKRFQQVVMSELPSLPIIATKQITVVNKRVHDHTLGAIGAVGSIAEAWLED